MDRKNHDHLVKKAVTLKKAWLCAVATYGAGNQLKQSDYIIPNYKEWSNKNLKIHLSILQEDFVSIMDQLFSNWKKRDLLKIATWFCKKYDAFFDTLPLFFELGRVYEIEELIGRLNCHKNMDCPPYAQLILQGFNHSAFRHPEYHLASDLAFLYNLHLDIDEIHDNDLLRRGFVSTENSQSLSRSVILTSFNLLESFISGLALAWLMEHPNAPEKIVKKLKNNNLSLRKKFITYPDIVSGKNGIVDDKSHPFEPLFNDCKQRRDSFVHCEPGTNPTKWGYVKENHFHDVNIEIVKKTVELTFEAICHVWKAVHNRDKPSWLPKQDENGRFENIKVKIVTDDNESN